VRLSPVPQQIADNGRHEFVELLESAPQDSSEIEALRVVVQLAPVHDQSRRLCKRLRQGLVVEQMSHVVLDSGLESAPAESVTSELVDLCQCLQDETRVVMVDERPASIDGVVPRTVRILGVQYEAQIRLSGAHEVRVVKIAAGPGQEKGAIRARIHDEAG